MLTVYLYTQQLTENMKYMHIYYVAFNLDSVCPYTIVCYL